MLFTEEDLLEELKLSIITNIFNIRAREITNTTDSTWLDAEIGASRYTNNDMFSYLSAAPKDGKFIDSIKALFDEYERAMIHGVTAGELQMIKTALFSSWDNLLANKDKVSSANIVSQIVSYVVTGAPPQSVEDYCKVSKKLLASITVKDLDECLRNSFKDRGTKLVVMAPKGYKDLPSEKELLNVWKNYKSEEILAYHNAPIDKLMDKPSTKANIKSKQKNKTLGTTEYVFDNGIKIITKKTNFEKDTIVMQASSNGGSYQISDEDFPSFAAALNYAIGSGFNGVTYNQFMKFLTDKNVVFRTSITTVRDRITGASTNKDFEYLLQCVNLMFTGRQYTDSSWQLFLNSASVAAKNHGATPEDAFNDKLNEMVYGKNELRYAPFDMKAFAKLDQKKAQKIVDERFANPADFTFTFVGDFNENKLIELCQYYLGSMPTTDDREELKYLHWDFPKGKNTATVKKGLDEKGRVFIAFGGDLPPSKDVEEGFKDYIIMDELAALLDIRLREVIREENSGSYGVGADGYIGGYPERSYIFQIDFGCEPKRCEELSSAVLETIKEIQTKGVSDDNIQKLRESFRRERETNLRNNWWWLGKIEEVSVFATQPEWSVRDLEKICSWITSDALQDAAKKYLDTENFVRVFLKPEK